MDRRNAWKEYNEKEQEELYALNERYKTFISECKTERECVKGTIALAKAKGYRDLDEIIAANEVIGPGDRVYRQHMGKTIALFQIGTSSLEEGMNILGAHIDSPRLDIKQNPLYEDTELAYLDTHYYGGIKKYQWVALPLAMHGVVAKKDGTLIDVVIGEKESDPVLGITDLLPHLGKIQEERKGSNIVEGEDLNILIGSQPLQKTEKDAVKALILQILKEQYNIEEEDFLSAELEMVPAGKARDYGLDRSMVMGYGQDDRVCAYTSLEALLDTEKSERTSVCLLVDKEEIGSVGATGMHSVFFENTIAEILDRMSCYSGLAVRRTLQNSRMLSSDVSAAFDPIYPSVMEKVNAAYFGRGLTFNKFTGSRGKSGSNDANAEYIAHVRKVMDDHKVAFQTAELGKVDQGGGGTIAYSSANYGMEVIDSGVPVLSMHAPWEICSKADIYEAKKGYMAFLSE